MAELVSEKATYLVYEGPKLTVSCMCCSILVAVLNDFLGLQVLLSLPGMQDLLEALASYTQRHFVRIDRLVRSSFLLDYTLSSMNVIMPEADCSVSEGMQLLHAPSLQPTTVAVSDANTADGSTQAALAEQSIPAQQTPGEGEMQQELSDTKLDGSHEQLAGSLKTKVSSKRRKPGSKPTEANASDSIKVKRKKA